MEHGKLTQASQDKWALHFLPQVALLAETDERSANPMYMYPLETTRRMYAPRSSVIVCIVAVKCARSAKPGQLLALSLPVLESSRVAIAAEIWRYRSMASYRQARTLRWTMATEEEGKEARETCSS